MERSDLLATVLPGRALPLWVPLLTPWKEKEGRAVVDLERLRRHAEVVRAHTGLWMIAGSTGDGWELDDDAFERLLHFAAGPVAAELRARSLVAVLRPSTQEVCARIERVHVAISTSARADARTNADTLVARNLVGLCVCPPVGEDVDQQAILDHYDEVIRVARMPIAVYELPQVTGCRIEPATFGELVRRHPEILLFKDSSGEDRIAPAAPLADAPVLVRGAEGSYVDALRAAGGSYDGLLLSTANNFADELVGILRAALGGSLDAARAHAEALQQRVEALFEAAADEPAANAFANANRAVDHLLAHGARWREVEPPLLFDGSRLRTSLLERAAMRLEEARRMPETGYLDVD